MFLFFLKIILYIPFLIFFPTKIYGKKNKRLKGKAIYASNHLSNIDIVCHVIHTAKKDYVLAKKELFKPKLWGAIVKNVGGIKIDRKGVDITALKQCLSVLKKGKKLFIFPEGTRNRTDAPLLQIKPGASLIAIKTKTPIIPVAILRRKQHAFSKTYMLYGEPFELSEFYGEKLNEENLAKANKIIEQKMLENIENLKKIRSKKKKS